MPLLDVCAAVQLPGCCLDCLPVTFCGPCAVIQELNQLEIHKRKAAIPASGGLAGVGGGATLVVQPYSQPVMLMPTYPQQTMAPQQQAYAMPGAPVRLAC